MEQVITNAGIGVVSSVFIAGAGYFQASKEENFDATKFLKTIILGGIVGGVAGFTGLAPDAIIAMPYYAGITAFVEHAIKGFMKRLRGN